MWICCCESSRHGGCPLDAGETESELRGERGRKVQRGEVPVRHPAFKNRGGQTKTTQNNKHAKIYGSGYKQRNGMRGGLSFSDKRM